MHNIEDVKYFWENNPLWTGESQYDPGSIDFFEEHKQVYISDCFAGTFDENAMPDVEHRERVLDLGCGPGFWLIEIADRGAKEIVGADLTENALSLAKKRSIIYGYQNISFSQQNAEKMSFNDGEFDHVNCQGVIHHTPNTEQCVAEIARVIRVGGTASISVYYKNIFLRSWPLIRWAGKVIERLGGGLKGRGREGIYGVDDANEIIRLYDGQDNPIGKAYTQREFKAMLEPYFEVECLFLHFFPARSLPFKIPKLIHRFLDRHFGFMIYASLRKKS